MRIRTPAKARQRDAARAYLNDQGDLGRFLPGFDAYAGVAGPVRQCLARIGVVGRSGRRRSSNSPYDRYASRAWATKMPTLRTKKNAATTSKNMGQPWRCK